MNAGLISNCFGVTKALCETLFVAGLFYAFGADQLSILRPEIVDQALIGYRAAVDEALTGNVDMGDLDKQLNYVVAEIHPAKHYQVAKATIEREVHAAFDGALGSLD